MEKSKDVITLTCSGGHFTGGAAIRRGQPKCKVKGHLRSQSFVGAK